MRSSARTAALSILALALAGLTIAAVRRFSTALEGARHAARTPAAASRVVQVQAVRVSDDDGGRAARITPEQVRLWLGFADQAFAGAGIAFRFEDADLVDLRSTLLNGMMGTQDRAWPEEKRFGNETAARYPGRLVVFFRHGPGREADGSGFSWSDYDFVAMPGYDDARHCGHEHVDALAHEIGHYLGLPHTFAGEPFAGTREAEASLKARGGDPAVFDGDGFADTPPDPSLRPLECRREPRVTLAGREFLLPRDNLMSYYDERRTLSPEQVRRVRWTLDLRGRAAMAAPSNRGAGPGFEAEALKVASLKDSQASAQPMSGFGKGSWSGESQLLVNARPGGSITLVLHAAKTARYRIALFATRAPDYGLWKASLDSAPMGEVFDGYAPVVVPSGRIALGEARLSAGTHLLRLQVSGKNEASSGSLLGLDFVELREAGASRGRKR